MAPRPRILFVGHDASRTGAPRVLLSLLRWAGRHDLLGGVRLVLLAGGPLLEDLGAVLPTRVIGPTARAASSAGDAAASTGIPRGAIDAAVWRALVPRPGDTVVANTLAALPAAHAAVGRSGRLVAHVHELDGVASRVLPDGPGRERAVDRVDAWVAVGDAVAAMLVDRWGVPAERVTRVDAFIDDAPDPDEGEPPPRAGRPGGPGLLAVGEAGHRKGTDRFIALAAVVERLRPGTSALWLGGAPDGPAMAEARHDIARLAHPVEVAPTVPDPWTRAGPGTVVVAVAREDPYPLAVLEAGVRGHPVLAFDGGGAAAALRAAGLERHVVAPGDVIGLARRCVALLDDPATVAATGARLRRWVGSTHATDALAPAVWAAIEDAT